MAAVKPKTVTLMVITPKSTFKGRDGTERSMKDPDGAPSDKQLWLLHKRGHLAITSKPVVPFTKAEAAGALDSIPREQ